MDTGSTAVLPLRENAAPICGFLFRIHAKRALLALLLLLLAPGALLAQQFDPASLPLYNPQPIKWWAASEGGLAQYQTAQEAVDVNFQRVSGAAANGGWCAGCQLVSVDWKVDLQNGARYEMSCYTPVFNLTSYCGTVRPGPAWNCQEGGTIADPLKHPNGCAPTNSKGCPDDCGGAEAVSSFGDPINASVGNKYESRTEFRGIGRFPLEFTWVYNSNGGAAIDRKADAVLGFNRTHNYNRRVVTYSVGASVSAYVSRPDGKTPRFERSGNAWIPASEMDGDLRSILDPHGAMEGWTYRNSRNEMERFDASGRLLSITDSVGNLQELSYDTQGRLSYVSDMQGRTLIFVYSGARLESLGLPDGGVIQFAYDSAGNLQKVTYPDLKAWTYLYNEPALTGGGNLPHALTGELDENSSRYSFTTYDAAGRAIGTYLAAGVDASSATYTLATDGSYVTSATIAGPLGAARTVRFELLSGRAVPVDSTESCSGCISRTKSFQHYPSGRISSVEDASGVTTSFAFDGAGLQTQRVDADNDATGHKRTIATDWNPALRMPAERRTYDALDTLVRKETWSYNGRGQSLVATTIDPITGLSRSASTRYCEATDVSAGTCPMVGLITEIDGPRTDVSDVTRYAYYASDDSSCTSFPSTCPHRKGDLWKVTNALNQVTEFLRYDGAGRVLSSKDANGVVTDREYHPRGWLTATKVRGTNDASEADDQTTRIDYYPTGLVEKTTLPDGSLTRFEYDAAHRLTKIFDNVGNSIVYSLDDAGNRTGEETKDASGTLLRTLSRVYDQLGRLREVKDAYERGSSFTYDALGNLDTSTDALLHVTDNDYDPLNRLEQTLQDVGGIQAKTKFAYDALDNLRKVTDPKNLNTEYEYNGFGDLVRLKSPDSGETTYAYDSAGNRSSQTDARGVTTSYTYDALNRLKSVSYSDGTPLVSYVYDVEERKLICRSLSNPSLSYAYQVGRLGYMVDASGLTRFCYDRFGRLFAKGQITNGKSFITQYKYNEGGALASIIYPSGASVGYVRNSNGQVSGMTWTPSGGTAQVLLTSVSYYPFGPPAEIEYGDGRRVARSLNLNYQPGIIQDLGPDGLSLGFEFDPVGNLSVLRNGTQSDPPLRSFTYDALSRLKEVDNGSGLLLWGYDYDATGNRLAAQDGAVSASYAYPAESHRLSSVGGVARSYDAAGNTTGIGGTAQQFVFDGSNRMAQTLTAGVVVMNYIYNGKGEQVRRFPTTSSTEQNYFTYDEYGHLLGIYNASGQRLQEFIWLDDLPVGLVASNKLHYIEPDHLGTPRVVIDPTRERGVWKWGLTGEAFGKSAPDEDPDGDGIPLVVDLRFPGQRFDVASGLNQNYQREYEAGTGRYTQPDPLGLKGGLNTYRYVYANPLVFMDPEGLKCMPMISFSTGRETRMVSRTLVHDAGWSLNRVSVDPDAPGRPMMGRANASQGGGWPRMILGGESGDCWAKRVRTFRENYEVDNLTHVLELCIDYECDSKRMYIRGRTDHEKIETYSKLNDDIEFDTARASGQILLFKCLEWLKTLR